MRAFALGIGPQEHGTNNALIRTIVQSRGCLVVSRAILFGTAAPLLGKKIIHRDKIPVPERTESERVERSMNPYVVTLACNAFSLYAYTLCASPATPPLRSLWLTINACARLNENLLFIPCTAYPLFSHFIPWLLLFVVVSSSFASFTRESFIFFFSSSSFFFFSHILINPRSFYMAERIPGRTIDAHTKPATTTVLWLTDFIASHHPFNYSTRLIFLFRVFGLNHLRGMCKDRM